MNNWNQVDEYIFSDEDSDQDFSCRLYGDYDWEPPVYAVALFDMSDDFKHVRKFDSIEAANRYIVQLETMYYLGADITFPKASHASDTDL